MEMEMEVLLLETMEVRQEPFRLLMEEVAGAELMQLVEMVVLQMVETVETVFQIQLQVLPLLMQEGEGVQLMTT